MKLDTTEMDDTVLTKIHQNALVIYARAPTGSFVALIVLLLCLTYFGIRQLILPKPIPGIPYNIEASRSVKGDMPGFLAHKNRRSWWAEQPVRHNSPLVQVFLRPFQRPWVFVADYYEAADICMRRTKEFDRADGTIAMFEGVVPEHHMIMHSDDPKFRRNRELIRDIMNPSFIQEVSGPEFHAKFSALLDLWKRKMTLSGGRPFESSMDIHNAALDIVMAASFGLDASQSQLAKTIMSLTATPGSVQNHTGTIDDEFFFQPIQLDPELSAFVTLVDSLNVSIRSPFPRISHFLHRNLDPEMRRAAKGRDSLRNRMVAESVARKKDGKAQRCALDNMLQREDAIASKDGREPNYYSETIMSELLGFLIAGHETTSSALRWGIKYLTERQGAQRKLREALREAHPKAMAEHRLPSVDEIEENRPAYLDGVIEETLRHALPSPITLRQAMMDTHVMGVPIPKGTTVGFLANGPGVLTPTIPTSDTLPRTETVGAHIKRVPKFDESTIGQFLPERWLATRTSEKGEVETVFDANAGPVQAFGQGPRGCFGKKLAYIEMRVFFTLVIWEFELLPLTPELGGNDEAITMTRSPKNVRIKLCKVDY